MQDNKAILTTSRNCPNVLGNVYINSYVLCLIVNTAQQGRHKTGSGGGDEFMGVVC